MTANGINGLDVTVSMIRTWLQVSNGRDISIGLDPARAAEAACRLRDALNQQLPPQLVEVSTDLAETLHALTAILAEEEPSRSVLKDSEKCFDFVKSLQWPPDRLGGPEDVLSRLAFLCWRAASCLGEAAAADRWLRQFHAEGKLLAAMAADLLAVPRDERPTDWNDAEKLLAICELLRRKFEAAPSEVLAESEYFFHFLEAPVRVIGQSNEREYFLGEFALIAGTACRILALRDRARQWFDRAEPNFVLANLSSAHVSRVVYQRLALRLEERDFEAIADIAPRWVEAFAQLDLPDDSLKCRFLEAHALKETERLEEAKHAFREIRDHAKAIESWKLAAIASENLFQVYAFLGEAELARHEAEYAMPLLRKFENRIGLAKLQMGLGYLLRSEGSAQASIAAFRVAQKQFAELGLRADVAATHLVLADLLLDSNQPAQAEREIRAALPVIDELKLVPERVAALSMLRDSIRRRQIDRQALRSLNGYFEELKS